MTIKSSSQHSLMQAVAHNPAKEGKENKFKGGGLYENIHANLIDINFFDK